MTIILAIIIIINVINMSHVEWSGGDFTSFVSLNEKVPAETTKTAARSFTVCKCPTIHRKLPFLFLTHAHTHLRTEEERSPRVLTAQAAVRSRPQQIIGSSVSMKALLDFCSRSVRTQHVLQPLLHLRVRLRPLRALFITIINLPTPLGICRRLSLWATAPV